MPKNSIKNIKNILTQYNIKPFRGLGQNFLINRVVLKKIIKASELKPSDIILEIGPGTGVLTQELAKHSKKVIAVEKDRKMVRILKEILKDYKNVEIIQGDVLKINPLGSPLADVQKNYKIKNYKVIANLPYYITSPVIRKFLENKNPPELMVLMTQKEVAQRICTKPPKMNLLAVSVQFYGKPKIISYVSKQSFWPQPEVDSAIIKIVPSGELKKKTGSRLFFKIVKAGFSQPRKQIINNFKKVLKLKKQSLGQWLGAFGIKPNQRAETLKMKDWINLSRTVNKYFPAFRL